ncbi:hypothetical protein AGMMS49944_14210 [Spirochaetia bacterium]|nr:hypothetical protein AGMMS49944_14210 [Spirochaetia bacterium]
MFKRKSKTFFIFLGFSLFLGSCGGLGTVFESQGSYRVNASVDNGYTLDEYSIINQNSKISPFFVNSVVNDPDVRGLTVFVQDLSGIIVSRKIRYVLAADAQEETPPNLSDTSPEPVSPGPTSPEPDSPEPDSPDPNFPEPVSPEPDFPEPISPEPDFPEPNFPEPDSPDPNFPEPISPEPDFPEPDSPEPVSPEPYFPETDSSEPDFPEPDSPEPVSPEPDSPEPSFPETPQAAEPSGSGETAEEKLPAADSSVEQVVVVKQLDRYLPSFRIFEDLAIGRYNLVFQVIGERAVLYTAFKPVYFLKDASFTLGDIQSYLPGVSSGGRLIPPGINVVLETKISADRRLDPYVVWYSGKKVIAQGRVSEGAQYLLWKTPAQTGFHTVRAEVFPLLPEERLPGNIIGKIKELSLAVSSKSSGPEGQGMRRLTGSSNDPITWYQFGGSLTSNNPDQHLTPLLSQKPRWIPFAGMYGLFTGADDGYALPGKTFVLSEGEQRRGRIFFYFAALSAGTIFNARFAAKDNLEGTAVLDLSLAGGKLLLRVSAEEILEESLALTEDETGKFITAIIDFEIAPDRLGASLALENPLRETPFLDLAVPVPLSGEAAFRLGGTENPAGYKRNTQLPAFDKNGKPRNGIAIFNELALSYPVLPKAPSFEP